MSYTSFQLVFFIVIALILLQRFVLFEAHTRMFGFVAFIFIFQFSPFL